jgi:hypothetical protein
LDTSKRLGLLEASLPKLADAKLRAIPQLLLETHPGDLPLEYYSSLLPGLPEELQELLPGKVRRRCWELFPQAQFRGVSDSLIDLYLNDKLSRASNESFDLQAKRRRDKIPALEMLQSVLADSKPLLRVFQAQLALRTVGEEATAESVAAVAGMYLDALLVTGPYVLVHLFTIFFCGHFRR